jgi:hypothetical protein
MEDPVHPRGAVVQHRPVASAHLHRRKCHSCRKRPIPLHPATTTFVGGMEKWGLTILSEKLAGSILTAGSLAGGFSWEVLTSIAHGAILVMSPRPIQTGSGLPQWGYCSSQLGFFAVTDFRNDTIS